MKLKWQWFLGGRVMFWLSIILFIILICEFVVTYIINPIEWVYMIKQNIDTASIKELSEEYVDECGITIDKPIEYRFVRYKTDKGFKEPAGTEVLLGTFHEWNGTYYINISVDLYKLSKLKEVVRHETRHMIVEYLRQEKIINLDKYTEEIAQEKNIYYNDLFDSGVYLLKVKQEKERK